MVHSEPVSGEFLFGVVAKMVGSAGRDVDRARRVPDYDAFDRGRRFDAGGSCRVSKTRQKSVKLVAVEGFAASTAVDGVKVLHDRERHRCDQRVHADE